MSVHSASTDAPNYDVRIDVSDLLDDLRELAGQYGRDAAETDRWYRESLDHFPFDPFEDARYWFLEAHGGHRAVVEAIALLVPDADVSTVRCGRYRRDDGSVDVRGYMRELSRLSTSAHERSRGPYTQTRQAEEAETAYVRVLSLLRDDYGVGWPRFDELGGILEEDEP